MAAYDTDLQELYVAYFGRPADPVALTYWNNVISSAVAAGQNVNTALDSVRDSFGASSEYLANFANLTSVQKIARIYNNLFSHDPDPTGLVYWANRLESGELTIGQISKIIADVARIDPTNVDGIAFNSKVAAAELFTAALDTTAEIVGYSGSVAGNIAKSFITNVNSQSTLATATAPANLSATILAATTATSNHTVSFGQKDITQLVDNFTNNAGQKLDLGVNLKIHAPVSVTDVPGIQQPETLKYSIDSKGVITFSGSLETTKAYSALEKAAIIERILGDDYTSVVFYKVGSDVFAFANNGITSGSDHLVKITGIANQFQGGHINLLDGSITADVGQFSSPDMSGWSMCDIRLKKDVYPLGKTRHGIKLYSFSYHGDERRYIGPMAQEILSGIRHAHAVGQNEFGYYQVDFRALGLEYLASSSMMSAGMKAMEKKIYNFA